MFFRIVIILLVLLKSLLTREDIILLLRSELRRSNSVEKGVIIMNIIKMIKKYDFLLLLTIVLFILTDYVNCCDYTVVDGTVDCRGFATKHGKLTLNGNQLVDANGGNTIKYLSLLSS